MSKTSVIKDESVACSDSMQEAIKKRRQELFHSGWKNPKQIQPLISREQDNAFKFLVSWCEEFDEVLFKHRDRLSDPTPRIRQKKSATNQSENFNNQPENT